MILDSYIISFKENKKEVLINKIWSQWLWTEKEKQSLHYIISVPQSHIKSVLCLRECDVMQNAHKYAK